MPERAPNATSRSPGPRREFCRRFLSRWQCLGSRRRRCPLLRRYRHRGARRRPPKTVNAHHTVDHLATIATGLPFQTAWESWTPVTGRRDRVQAQVRRATEHRYGQAAASTALSQITGTVWTALPAARNGDRRPAWPLGFVGSLSHTNGLAFAMTGRDFDTISIGVDVERVRAQNRSLTQRLASTAHHHRVPFGTPEEVTTTLVFSIQESVFKCVFPLGGVHYSWDECQIVTNWDAGTFRAKLRRPVREAEPTIAGRFRLFDGVVATACWIPTNVHGQEAKRGSAARRGL